MANGGKPPRYYFEALHEEKEEVDEAEFQHNANLDEAKAMAQIAAMRRR